MFKSSFKRALYVLGALMLALPLCGQAEQKKLYKWVDDQGKVHYTERLPQEAAGKATTTMTPQGTVKAETDRALSKQELMAKQDAERQREEAAKLATEERRKNEAVLSSYESEKDIELARARAIESNADAIKSAAHNLELAMKKRDELNNRVAFFKGKTVPAPLQREVEENDIDLKSQQQVLNGKKREAEQINARYDEDKRRFNRLTKGGAPDSTAAKSP